MKVLHGFELRETQTIGELQIQADLFHHQKTGAALLSLVSSDTNKVFGITFRTPPSDSTGVAHIMEHSVLCGSRKYPVKEPFVQLLKGSLQTFLNALTFPDKTCYPVASQNLKDFYNLVDVYLDAVFFPLITEPIFQQEGWHYEPGTADGTLQYKGVVYNEMKGVYSSPESLLVHYCQQSLFPDTTYGLDSGGDPKNILDLTYSRFRDFHQRYYHPSNALIFFYGDDPPEERLRIIDGYIGGFDHRQPDSAIPLQAPVSRPKTIKMPYPCGDTDPSAGKAMVAVNWLLNETADADANMTLSILDYILMGMPASPLRKVLIDSGIGEGITGVGLENELRQMYFSTGLKGVAPGDASRVEPLIMETLAGIAEKGLDRRTVEAAMNTAEFRLRENNTGRYPRGLILMLRALSAWLYGSSPCSLIAFEAPLKKLKAGLDSDRHLFEDHITRHLLKNMHRTTLILEPDAGMMQREEANERARAETERAAMSREALSRVAENARELQRMQQAPDSPEALSTIPRLRLTDIDRQNQAIPLKKSAAGPATVFYHDLFTSGIFYVDVGFDLHLLPQKYLPYLPLFSRALLETGTRKEDFVSLSQRIGQSTGGIGTSIFTSAIKDSAAEGTAWLFLRGKAMPEGTGELFDILTDVLLTAQLDNRARLKQILLEERAELEQRLVPHGNAIVDSRLRAHFNEADWVDEITGGVSHLLFLRALEKKVAEDSGALASVLEEIRHLLISRNALVVNATVDEQTWKHLESDVHECVSRLPLKDVQPADWTPAALPECEGMITPSRINFVGKGINLYDLGYSYHGSVHVVTQFLRTTWLWDRVRVQGGAYGASCSFDRLSGGLTFVSYRDPNLLKTIDVFDSTARFLADYAISSDELVQNIIGAIGDIDAYMHPDAKGYLSLQRFLNGNTDEARQRMREQILDTTPEHFRAFAGFLSALRENGLTKVLGSEDEIRQANKRNGDFLKTFAVL